MLSISSCVKKENFVPEMCSTMIMAADTYNLGTQVTWRTRAEIEYIEGSLDRMLYLAVCNDVKAIAMPAIGAGLGGLKWDDVKRCIERVASSYPMVDLYVVEAY